MRSAPLILDQSLLIELKVTAHPKFGQFDQDSTIAPEALKVNVEVAQREDMAAAWVIQLTLGLEDETESAIPYAFEIVTWGAFRVSDDYPYDSQALVFTNGPAILYSSAREILALVTGRGPYPAVMLPTVNFLGFTPDSEPEAKAVVDNQPPATEKVAKARKSRTKV